ncbi:hypothetical protein ATCR1_07819 [Agrobacterium tumefaciens CCNWGS0286]|nr:hypothetical protein ATCR1_07819 [Agrobacterium tumefaciens CCNWGS0286]
MSLPLRRRAFVSSMFMRRRLFEPVQERTEWTAVHYTLLHLESALCRFYHSVILVDAGYRCVADAAPA